MENFGIISIRGAITVKKNTICEIEQASRLLYRQMIFQNKVQQDQIIHLITTMTADLNACYPTQILRRLEGMQDTPCLNFEEKNIPGSLPGCIRFMMTCYSALSKAQVCHVYLNEAVQLRPDIPRRS